MRYDASRSKDGGVGALKYEGMAGPTQRQVQTDIYRIGTRSIYLWGAEGRSTWASEYISMSRKRRVMSVALDLSPRCLREPPTSLVNRYSAGDRDGSELGADELSVTSLHMYTTVTVDNVALYLVCPAFEFNSSANDNSYETTLRNTNSPAQRDIDITAPQLNRRLTASTHTQVTYLEGVPQCQIGARVQRVDEGFWGARTTPGAARTMEMEAPSPRKMRVESAGRIRDSSGPEAFGLTWIGQEVMQTNSKARLWCTRGLFQLMQANSNVSFGADDGASSCNMLGWCGFTFSAYNVMLFVHMDGKEDSQPRGKSATSDPEHLPRPWRRFIPDHGLRRTDADGGGLWWVEAELWCGLWRGDAGLRLVGTPFHRWSCAQIIRPLRLDWVRAVRVLIRPSLARALSISESASTCNAKPRRALERSLVGRTSTAAVKTKTEYRKGFVKVLEFSSAKFCPAPSANCQALPVLPNRLAEWQTSANNTKLLLLLKNKENITVKRMNVARKADAFGEN
ncbi:hypothetical protein BJ138DRAFT_1183860 [Hygrophoropsis aurantiaca]|uniref:Uncharacterized protein n=1 Tax=Hygrophoropsis aurantiaca TaxID=72124 RepID=A0ACB7ZUX7_9AGAM|nr:hypothetical protein BJ138DRAFT_1183860 [Hygrophoropsis aurantiaca]